VACRACMLGPVLSLRSLVNLSGKSAKSAKFRPGGIFPDFPDFADTSVRLREQDPRLIAGPPSLCMRAVGCRRTKLMVLPEIREPGTGYQPGAA
jgi:hypothetical protein